MRRLRILVVDDEVSILKFLSSNLRVAAYDVLTATTGEEALALARDELPDLVILDLMLPGIDGWEVCQRLRAFSEVAIIVLSARGELGDKIKALNLGADDYLTKPFGVEELLARVRAVLRRSRRETANAQALISTGPFTLDPDTRLLTVAGRMIRLTPTEFNLLHCLMQHAGKLMPHSLLLREIWGPEYRGQPEYLHVYVGRLRHKIEENSSNPRYLLTKPGVGYIFLSEPCLPSKEFSYVE